MKWLIKIINATITSASNRAAIISNSKVAVIIRNSKVVAAKIVVSKVNKVAITAQDAALLVWMQINSAKSLVKVVKQPMKVVMHMSLPLKKLVKLAEQPMQVVTLMNLRLKKHVKRVP